MKISRDEDGGALTVEVGGLARTDNAGWGEEFDRLVIRLLPETSEQPPGKTTTNTRGRP